MEAPSPAARALTVLREAKGWTQRDLARAAEVSQAVLSKAETGLAGLGGRLVQVADALGCPPEVLQTGLPLSGAPVTCLHHRRRASRLSAKDQKRVQALAQLTRVSVTAIMAAADQRPEVNGLLAGRELLDDPVEAAVWMRDRFGLGDGPIVDAVALVERTGCVVVIRDLGPGGQDAVSSWAGAGNVPLVLVNGGLPGDRLRFTALHELCHVLLHVLPEDGQEQEAHRFAAELLMPAVAAHRELAGLTATDFRRLLALKETWGVSIGALIQRALDVGAIDENQFRDMRIRLSRLGWHRIEPGDLPVEQPARLAGYLAHARRCGATDADLAAASQLTLRKFRAEGWLSSSTDAQEEVNDG